MSKPINQLVDELPTSNITTFALKSLDFAIPGQWDNLVGWDNTIRTVTQETDDALIQMVSDRAIALYSAKSQGYQQALWLYQTIDSVGSTLGTAALANKVGEKVPLLGFLNKLTPKADKAQTLDLALKLVVEIVAFCKVNGIPGDSIGDFLKALGDYSGGALTRMAALVAFDGLIPLGPDFIRLVTNKLDNLSPSELQKNAGFKKIGELIPGNSAQGKLNFVGESFDSVKGWMNNFIQSRDLTPQKVSSSLQNFIDVSDDKLDYLAAFLDMSTNYYEHTGVQTLARRLIDRAVAEI
ncbi:hypothetical protein IQ235_15640 [Oscillatoriales cyanobacterium LEGE 11467]|uniref:Uncharacterized protein n=1 Tax=Zarconia navalis LEGE 11467 TaxID=1828826 RepID=A0A928W1F4_9CYAN|nr:hypothetical protein [Zarconia navalis]MBE9042211.1 hypothetical protein [Zarconia navalis LEGE 11467]